MVLKELDTLMGIHRIDNNFTGVLLSESFSDAIIDEFLVFDGSHVSAAANYSDSFHFALVNVLRGI